MGMIAKLDKIQFVSGLPKTRSGKIMRRILRKIAEGDFSNFGDTSTLLNPEIVDEIRDTKVIINLIKVENLQKDFQPFYHL
jgi:acetyl-CoA synthetase